MIGIRVDGNVRLGTGHIMRCLSLAKQLERAGEKPVFFCTQKQDRVLEAGYACVVLGGAYNNLSEEDLLQHLKAHGIGTLLVDSYFTDKAYYKRLAGSGVKVAVLFDMGDSTVPCDLLIDYNVNYPSFQFAGAKQTLLGPNYAPLREEFEHGCKERQFQSVRNILITAGGSDPAGVTGALIKALRKEPLLAGAKLHVVIGGMNPTAAQLRAEAAQLKDVFLLQNVSNMAQLMQQADICVSAGGTTLYEICACGLPCVTFSVADNQDEMIAAMQQAGVMLSAGIYRRNKQACLHEIVQQTKALFADAALREALSHSARNLVDGRGAARIAKAIIAL